MVKELLTLCNVPNANDRFKNHDLWTHGIMRLANTNNGAQMAHSELMAHARHTSLKSQQPYLRNSAAGSAKFQVALSPVPIPPVNTQSKKVAVRVRKATQSQKARMKAPPSESLTAPIPRKSRKRTCSASPAPVRKSRRIESKKSLKKSSK